MSGLATELARIQKTLRGVADPLGMLEGIFAFAPFGLQIYRADGVCLLVNQAFREMFGSEPPPGYCVLRDEVAAKAGVLDLVKRAFAGERVFVPATWYDARAVEHVKVTEGRRVAVEATVFPLFGASGEVEHVALVFKDVTAELSAKDATQRMAQLHAVASRLAAASTPREVAEVIVEHGVSVLDVRRSVVGVLAGDGATVEVLADRGFGAETYSLHRFPTAAAVPLADAIRTGQPVFLADPDELKRAYPDLAAIAATLDTGAIAAVPIANGERAIGAIAVDLPKDAKLGDEERAYLIALSFQAAQALDRARLFREAQEAARRAEEASRAKDEFLGVLSHELRTPLNAIQGWAHLAATRGRGDPEFLDRAVEVILRNVRAQVTLVEDMLDVARIIRGKLRLALTPVPMGPVVEAAVDAVRPTAAAKGIELSVDVPGDVFVLADADRVQQVVWNLLSNAIKFTDRGGKVAVHAEDRRSMMAISVTDDGIGLAPEDLPFVFDRFRQVDSSTTRAKGGLGLGLAIARHLVEAHGGTVRASSAGKGKGATFLVELPTTDDPAGVVSHEKSRAAASAVSIGPDALRGSRILVVDDEADAADLIAVILGERGALVRTARSKRAAMDVLASFRADVVVTDIGMPDEDGFALLRALRALPEHSTTPVIALTAHARHDDVDATQTSGFGWYIVKPVDPLEVVRVVFAAASATRAPASPRGDEQAGAGQ